MNRRGFLATALWAVGALPFVKAEQTLALIEPSPKKYIQLVGLVIDEVSHLYFSSSDSITEVEAIQLPEKPGYRSCFKFKIPGMADLHPGDNVELLFDVGQVENWGLTLIKDDQLFDAGPASYFHEQVML